MCRHCNKNITPAGLMWHGENCVDYVINWGVLLIICHDNDYTIIRNINVVHVDTCLRYCEYIITISLDYLEMQQDFITRFLVIKIQRI